MRSKHAAILESLKQLVYGRLCLAGERADSVLRERRQLLGCWYDVFGRVIGEMTSVPVGLKQPVPSCKDEIGEVLTLNHQVFAYLLCRPFVWSIDQLQKTLETCGCRVIVHMG
ncbi:MAG: hypothetical protein J0I74_12410 [Rhodanobacter sp.]|nr:hypothetical protein [Rhodanobacter sp.]